MNLNEFVKKLKNYLGLADATYLLGKRKNLFLMAIETIENDAAMIDKGENPPPLTPKGIELFIESLEYLLAILNEQPIGEEGSQFIDFYSTLVYNHNQNTNKVERINLLSQTVNRFVNLRITTTELLQNLRRASKTLKELSHVGFQPTQLSKHYLASFDQKINK